MASSSRSSWLVPADLLDEGAKAVRSDPLDLERERARYGGAPAVASGCRSPYRPRDLRG